MYLSFEIYEYICESSFNRPSVEVVPELPEGQPHLPAERLQPDPRQGLADAPDGSVLQGAEQDG